MDKNSQTHRALKNISYRFVAYVWPMLFTIFITPIIVLKLGVKEYGIYLFISAVTGIIGLLDLGVAFSVIKFLAGYTAQGDEEKVKRLTRSANSLFLLIGLGGLIISSLLSLIGSWLFPNQITDPQYYFTLFLIAGVSFFVSSINNLYLLIPEALQRFDISSKINIVYLTLSSLANLVVVILGYKLHAIFVAQLILVIIFFLVRRYYALKILPWAKYRLGWDKEEIKRCYQFGLATVINNTASTSLAYLDKLIIPIFIGPSQLTYYSLPGNVAARIPGVTDNLSGIIFPVSASMASTNEQEKIKRFYIRSVRLITIIASAISFSIIFLAQPLLRYWLNADFSEKSSGVLIILVITNFVIALLSPINSFLFGLGKLKFSSAINTVMAIINAVLLLILLPRFGIIGASWAYLLSVLPIFYMVHFVEKKYLHLEGRGLYYAKTFFQLSVSAIILYFVAKFLISPLIVNMATLVILGPITVLIYLLIYRLLNFFEKEDITDIQNFGLLLLKRLNIFKKKKT